MHTTRVQCSQSEQTLGVHSKLFMHFSSGASTHEQKRVQMTERKVNK